MDSPLWVLRIASANTPETSITESLEDNERLSLEIGNEFVTMTYHKYENNDLVIPRPMHHTAQFQGSNCRKECHVSLPDKWLRLHSV